MENKGEGELVRKGEISASGEKTIDFMISRWREKSDVKSKKELEQTYVLVFFYLAAENYGAGTDDIRKLDKEQLIVLRNRILPSCSKFSQRWRAWFTATLLSVLCFMLMIFFNAPPVFFWAFTGPALINLYVRLLLSITMHRDMRKLFFELHEKLSVGSGDRYFPDDYKEAFLYHEKRFMHLPTRFFLSELRRRLL